MDCPRHGTVELVSTHNQLQEGAQSIHFLSCGCYGTAEQLRDPNYDPNPPAAPAAPDPRIAELETKVAALENAEIDRQPVTATPAAVAHADEVGVDLTQVEGSGGTILKADVAAAAAVEQATGGEAGTDVAPEGAA